jgi:monoamine oxidase
MKIDRRSFTRGMAATGLLPLMAREALGATRSRHSNPLDVLVLGAGVSGLQAAWMLEEQGLTVAVIEARQRVGGRVYTLSDEPGHPEMGFNTMGEGYGRGIDAAQRAGVRMTDVGSRYRAAKPPLLWIDGHPLTREEWARHAANPFPEELRSVLPGELVNKLISERSPLKDWSTWTDPASASLDVPLHDFLRAQGLSDPAIRLANDVSPYYGISSWDVSALMLEFNDGFVKAQMAAGPRSFGVEGGNAQLPIGMAKLLKGDIVLGKEIVAIETTQSGANVYCRDGSRFSAKRIVCSLPLATLRNVKILPGLTGAQAQAVSQIAYQPLSNAFLTASSPFWDDDALSPAMWTDGPVGTVVPQHFGATPEEITGFLVQARGSLASYWDRLGPDQALAMIISQIEAMRPTAKGKLSGRHYHSWSQDAYSGGAWAYFAPGQVTRLLPESAKPAGRLHFCGEHTATGARGVEGALESSERVALEVLQA